MHNILKSVSHYWSRDEGGIELSTFLLESSLECPYVSYVPLLLRGRLHLVRDKKELNIAEKELDIAL